MVAGAIVADLAPAGARGRYQGAFASAWAVARLAAPAVASMLFATVGPSARASAARVRKDRGGGQYHAA